MSDEIEQVQDFAAFAKQFSYSHLPEDVQLIARPFARMAIVIWYNLVDCPGRDVALRRLLEAKDAAVCARAAQPA